MATTTQHMNQIFLVLLLISFAISPAISTVPKECETDSTDSCIDKTKALALKIVAIVAILVTSMLGVTAPLFSRYVTFLHPDDNPWHKFPFTGFVAMLSGLVTLAIDSIATSLYTKKAVADDSEEKTTPMIIQIDHLPLTTKERSSTCSKQLLRYRVIAMVQPTTHAPSKVLSQLFASIRCSKAWVSVVASSRVYKCEEIRDGLLLCGYNTVPFGIALGIVLSSVYKDNSPTALITVGLLNACSAGLLIYMALVDLLAAEFMGSMLQGSVKLQLNCFGAALLGCGGMSVLAKWA
ncbi:Zinc/iron permease [Arabidopsis thaliana x Arabidopsis arenosa]|uniref:Zinc/iron permease n=1 Tax=Arabidopsis thaliana x Arabidopsis arenosa TaxID=1240361 RepID=A0A8T1XE04_9BRAS|nr:Zinc/iron permease [Arabidopsis thaliana x Arabidopsis arenosa]